MDWANEGFNQINTDVQPADENALIAALHGLLPQYSITTLDDAHQSNEHLGSHFGNFLNEPRSASAAVRTESQYRSNQQTPIDLQYDTFQNQRSLALLDHRLQSNVSLEKPQFQSSAFSGLVDDQSLAPLDNDVSPAQSQPGLGDLPYIFDHQSLALLDSQLQSGVLPAQSQPGLGNLPYIFNDQQSFTLFASFENLSHQQFSAAVINSGSTVSSNPAHFPNEQSSSIVIPLTLASAGYHNTSIALVIQDPRKRTRRKTSCIGCRIQKIKVFAIPLQQGLPRCQRDVKQ